MIAEELRDAGSGCFVAKTERRDGQIVLTIGNHTLVQTDDTWITELGGTQYRRLTATSAGVYLVEA